jgi:H+/Cl- antiporter ClcA
MISKINRIIEEFIYIICRKTAIAIIVGVLVGISSSIFLKLLQFGIDQSKKIDNFYVILPLALFLTSLIIILVSNDSKGHGTEKVIEAFHKNNGKINLSVVPIKMISSVITISFGGSAGKEGPCVQIGAGVCSAVSDLFRLSQEDRKELLICGFASGFASVFGTPISGAIFAVESLKTGRLYVKSLYLGFISSIVSVEVAKCLGIDYFYYTFNIKELVTLTLVLKCLACGVFLGVVSIILIDIFNYFGKQFYNLPIYEPLKGIVGGIILILLTQFLSTKYLGLGTDVIEGVIKGKQVPFFAFLWKIVFTSITFASGGSGGIFTPLFFIGSTSGSTFARIFNLNQGIFSALGIIGILAGASNTPVAALFVAVELFGVDILPLAAIVSGISFMTSGKRSIFSSQLLDFKYSNS